MSEEHLSPHSLSLEERKTLSLSGVSEIISFDEASIILHTSLGTLIVHGNELKLKTLSIDGGQVEVSGMINELIYEENKIGGIRRLFH